MKIVIPDNTTLLRVVINSRKWFYNQDWYFNEEFANENISGEWDLDSRELLPAGVWVYAHVYLAAASTLSRIFVWTGSHDSNGDQVYVGQYNPSGMQIHRHLKIRDEEFINPSKRGK